MYSTYVSYWYVLVLPSTYHYIVCWYILVHTTTLQYVNIHTGMHGDVLTELCNSLTDFYETILQKADSGGRPVAKPLSSKSVTKAAPVPAPDSSADAASNGAGTAIIEAPPADADAAAALHPAPVAASSPPPPDPPQQPTLPRGHTCKG
jgi:hypothetical protein